MKKIIALLLITIGFSFSYAQSDIKFGKVSAAELEETAYPEDPDAPAVILYKKQDTYYVSGGGKIELVTRVHVRIKIYNKDGFDHASHIIPLYRGRVSKEVVKKEKGFAYTLEEGKVVKTKMDKGHVFKNNVNFNWDEMRFTIPNVREGSVLEYTYEVWSPFFTSINAINFQYDIPVKYIETELRTPMGYNFAQRQRGYITLKPQASSTIDSRLGMEVNIVRFELKNVPALKKEPYIDNIWNYRSGVSFELKSITTRYTNREFAQTWGNVAERIGNSNSYKNELDKTRFFENDIKPIVGEAVTQHDKMQVIFQHVKSKYTWNGFDGKYFQKGFKDLLKEKSGNAADINLLLVAMMREAGINANPVVISTKDNSIPLFPTLERLNYVVAHANINGADFFMDATDRFSDINMMPIRNYNWMGLLINNQKKIWRQIKLNKPELSETLCMVNAALHQNGDLEGDIKSRYTNHDAYRFRKRHYRKNTESYLAEKERLYNGAELSDYSSKNADQYNGHVEENYHFVSENSARVTSDKIYFAPMSFLRLEENPFVSETRMFPIDFSYAHKETYRINIALPQGYAVESVPESVIVQLPDALGEFKFLCNATPNGIQLSVSMEITEAMIPATHYEFIKDFFSNIVEKESEQVILIKA